jgi:predicted nucleotidyltransferase
MAVRSTVPTLEALRGRRREILRIAAAHDASNVRVFGSVARGDADAASDIDFLVDVVTDKRGFEYFALLDDLEQALEDLLGFRVDVGTDVEVREHAQERPHAIPL